ncbi:MAG: ArsA family ATPase, partial [Deltaproteobacteria bacterium]
VAAAVASLAARRGKRVLACEVNANDRLPALLGAPPAGPDIAKLRENLWAVDVRPHEAMLEYARMKLHFPALVRAVFENRLMRYFLRAIPSLAEVVLLGKILFHVKELQGDRPRFDLVVVDAPATGHALALLRVPEVVRAAVPPGPLADDMRWMGELLADPTQTAVNLVSLPEEMPVNETLELARALRELAKLPLGACFVNGIWRSRVAPGELDRLPTEAPWPSVRDALRPLEARAELSTVELLRLRRGLELPVFELPYLFAAPGAAAETKPAGIVDELSGILEALLSGTGGSA